MSTTKVVDGMRDVTVVDAAKITTGAVPAAALTNVDLVEGTKGTDIVSAGTMVIGTDGGYFDITGTTGISTMTVAAGRVFTLQFDAVVTLTHSSTLYLSGAADFTTEANDHMTFISVAANDVRQIGTGLKDGGSPVVPDVITKSSSDPAITTNPSGGVGTVFLNTTSGEMYSCTDATTNTNVWTNVGPGTGDILPPYSVEFLVIAGGAGGSDHTHGGGGGGAGGYRTSYGSGSISGGLSTVESDLSLVIGTQYTISVGNGGNPESAGGTSSITGSDITDITTVGGGGGGTYQGQGTSGGSGGGHGRDGGSAAAAAGTANQGFAGGIAGSTTCWSAGGGGGAGAVGYAGAYDCASSGNYVNGNTAANGGAGLSSSITGSAVTRAGGGGGAWEASSGAGHQPPGGAGGGGKGGTSSGTANNQTAGAVNTGSGGGGQKGSGGSCNGGSGVVILRMLTSKYSSTTTGSPTVSTSGSDTILIYTGSGSYTA